MNGEARITERANRFIKAHGCRDASLQFGVVKQVLVRERLFDHQQSEFVHLPEAREIPGQGIRRVGVRHHGDVGEVIPDRPQHVHIAPRLDLYLDLPVSLADVPLNLVEKGAVGALNADGHPYRHGFGDPAQKISQRDAATLCFQVPTRHFNRGSCHGMPTEPRNRIQLPRVVDLGAHQRRQKPTCEHMPRGVGCFVGITRCLAGNAFRPGFNAGGLQSQQKNTSSLHAPAADLEELP